MTSEPVAFHSVFGRNIRLSSDGTEATRVESFNQALCFTNRPLAPEEKLVIKILEACKSWSGTLRIGVTENDPFLLADDLPKYVCPDLNMRPGNWGKALEESYVRENKEIVVYYKKSGRVMIQSGEQPPEEFIAGVSTRKPLYLLFDIYGNTKTISISQPTARTPLPAAAAIPVENSKAFHNASLTAASFAAYRSTSVDVRPSAARCMASPTQRGHFAVTDTVLKPGRTLIVKVDKVKVAKPIKIVLSAETPQSVYVCGSLETLCDTTYSLSVESDTPRSGDELAVAISRDGIVYVSHNNRRWLQRIHVDAQVDYHVAFDLVNVGGLSMIGLTNDLEPIDESPLAPAESKTFETTGVDCIICLETARTVLLEPCDHFALCEECARSLMKTERRECPVCRAVIKGVRRIYMI